MWYFWFWLKEVGVIATILIMVAMLAILPWFVSCCDNSQIRCYMKVFLPQNRTWLQVVCIICHEFPVLHKLFLVLQNVSMYCHEKQGCCIKEVYIATNLVLQNVALYCNDTQSRCIKGIIWPQIHSLLKRPWANYFIPKLRYLCVCLYHA